MDRNIGRIGFCQGLTGVIRWNSPYRVIGLAKGKRDYVIKPLFEVPKGWNCIVRKYNHQELELGFKIGEAYNVVPKTFFLSGVNDTPLARKLHPNAVEYENQLFIKRGD